jgi:hypothetical protein
MTSTKTTFVARIFAKGISPKNNDTVEIYFFLLLQLVIPFLFSSSVMKKKNSSEWCKLQNS